MASRAWSTVKQILLVLFVMVMVTGWEAVPVSADSGGTCQAAYGLTPTSISDWLKPTDGDTDLTTANRYDIMAARLLSSGLVDGSTCPAKGLNPDGSANGCGLELTLDAVKAWQNQYDPIILSYSQTNELPPKIVKAVIAAESQFWPAANWTRGEIGLGQMTEFGADLVLAWRPDYYQSICRQAFGNGGCKAGYWFIDPANQRLLRGLALKEIDATSPACPGGVDIDKGKQAVRVLTETLNASCSQSAHVFSLATGRAPSSWMSYDDYWRLVLTNYHAGAGCVYQALQKTANPNNWNSIASNFSIGCASGAEYIRRIEEQIKP